MRHIVLFLITCFLSSNIHSQDFEIKHNTSDFQWGMDTVKCPLEKENEKFFVIKLKSAHADYSFQIQCHLQRKEQRKNISYVLLEGDEASLFNNSVKNKAPEFELANIKPSFLNESISGYVMLYNEIKQFGFNNNNDNDKILESLSSLNKFKIMVDDKTGNETKVFRFRIDTGSASLSDFYEFCSLDYFD